MEQKDDGVFHMSFEDFLDFFGTCTVAKVRPHWFEKRFHNTFVLPAPAAADGKTAPAAAAGAKPAEVKVCRNLLPSACTEPTFLFRLLPAIPLLRLPRPPSRSLPMARPPPLPLLPLPLPLPPRPLRAACAPS